MPCPKSKTATGPRSRYQTAPHRSVALIENSMLIMTASPDASTPAAPLTPHNHAAGRGADTIHDRHPGGKAEAHEHARGDNSRKANQRTHRQSRRREGINEEGNQ